MIFRVSSHTDYIGPNSTYVAITGKNFDGIDFITTAIERGATTIVVQEDAIIASKLISVCTQKNIKIIRVPDTRTALCELSAKAYNYPAQKLRILAVTGTDGKTTSSYLLYHMLNHAGKKTALLSGVNNIVGTQEYSADLTTAKPDFLHYFFDQCVQQDIEYVVMETSAQAATLHRIDTLSFDGCIFTNLAHEHGENYSTREAYFEAKSTILAQKKDGAPLIVHDSPVVKSIIQRFGDVVRCSLRAPADCIVTCLQETLSKQYIEIAYGSQRYTLETTLIGDYNALNIAGAALLAHQLGAQPTHIIAAVKNFKGAKGRLERYQLPNGALAIIDYAHTPQAYAALLGRLRQYARKLVVVFGLAGGKDVTKRPIMGKIAATYSDLIVLTNDNPRNEDPQEIMHQVMAQLDEHERAKFVCEPDRERAIMYACQQIQEGDIVAILGKGGEHVQIIGTQRLPYSDEHVVKNVMSI